MDHKPDLTLIQQFLQEDMGSGDLTAQIIDPCKQARATVVTREIMVLCGQAWFEAIFKQLDDQVIIHWHDQEGGVCSANSLICEVTGQARALLTAERTALNVLQSLSATATVTRRYVEAVAGTGCRILDTRKTIPGLRMAQKYAVHCGGGTNHRIGLFDAILIKENHILTAGSIAAAVACGRAIANVPLEVEVENLDEFQQALQAQPDRIMLDNFSLPDLRQAVQLNQGQIELEASGNITLETIRAVAETGVDFISIGALTKHIQAVDLSMRVQIAD
jgi:nicotinate-nucleotide pyrophosphorylase (carboxylating)